MKIRMAVCMTAAALFSAFMLATPSFAAIEFGLEGKQHQSTKQGKPGAQGKSGSLMLLDTRNPNSTNNKNKNTAPTGPVVRREYQLTLSGRGGSYTGGTGIRRGSSSTTTGTTTIPTNVSLCDPGKNGNNGNNGVNGNNGNNGNTNGGNGNVGGETPTATTVPEPTSLLAWFVLAGLGVGLTFVRRK